METGPSEEIQGHLSIHVHYDGSRTVGPGRFHGSIMGNSIYLGIRSSFLLLCVCAENSVYLYLGMLSGYSNPWPDTLHTILSQTLHAGVRFRWSFRLSPTVDSGMPGQ